MGLYSYHSPKMTASGFESRHQTKVETFKRCAVVSTYSSMKYWPSLRIVGTAGATMSKRREIVPHHRAPPHREPFTKEDENNMSTKTKQAVAAKSAPANKPAVEDGFDDCSTLDIEGWFKADIGAKVHAKIRYLMKVPDKRGKARTIAVCELMSPCEHAVQNKQPVKLESGQIIGVGVNYMLRPILQYAANQGEFKATFTSKAELPGGNTCWKGTLGCKGVKAAPPAPITGGSGGDDDGDEDLGDADEDF